jgi:hypothetical protein
VTHSGSRQTVRSQEAHGGDDASKRVVIPLDG